MARGSRRRNTLALVDALQAIEPPAECLSAPITVIEWRDVKKIGRPTKLTQELIDAIADHVAENGSYVDDTCALFGISRAIYYRWKKQGEQDRDEGRETAHAAFVDALEKVDAFVRTRISRESYTGGGKWVPMMTLGERKYPDRFGRRTEAADSPRVIVQIGVRDGDVQVTPMVAASDRPKQLSE